jgi:hypothetical protein
VHQAALAGKKLAVKIQYPGVRDSINSDLKMVRPIAAIMFKISTHEMEQYIGEVESKLMEETDYDLELNRSMEITKLSAHLTNLAFPEYYPDLSCERMLVMDWLEVKRQCRCRRPRENLFCSSHTRQLVSLVAYAKPTINRIHGLDSWQLVHEVGIFPHL